MSGRQHHTAADALEAAQQEIARLREALTARVLREPLEIAASYDAPGETVGARLHGHDCAKALAFLSDVLRETS